MTCRAVLLILCLAPATWPQDAPPPVVSGSGKSKVVLLIEAGRFPASDRNMAVLVSATFAADGRWTELQQDESLGRKAIVASLRLDGMPQQPVEYSVASIRRRTQMLLMAQHDGTFEEIQKLPPFSRFAETNLRRLAAAYAMSGEEGLKLDWEQIFAPGWEANRPAASIPKLEGGNGDTRESAVRIMNAASDGEGIAMKYDYISYVVGRQNQEWTRGKQSVTHPDEKGRRLDVLEINLTGGGQRTFFFDITDFYGKR